MKLLLTFILLFMSTMVFSKTVLVRGLEFDIENHWEIEPVMLGKAVVGNKVVIPNTLDQIIIHPFLISEHDLSEIETLKNSDASPFYIIGGYLIADDGAEFDTVNKQYVRGWLMYLNRYGIHVEYRSYGEISEKKLKLLQDIVNSFHWTVPDRYRDEMPG